MGDARSHADVVLGLWIGAAWAAFVSAAVLGVYPRINERTAKGVVPLATGLRPIQDTMVESVRRPTEAEIPEQIQPDLPVEDMTYLLVRVGSRSSTTIYSPVSLRMRRRLATRFGSSSRETGIPGSPLVERRESDSRAGYFASTSACGGSTLGDRREVPHIVPSGAYDSCGGFGNREFVGPPFGYEDNDVAWGTGGRIRENSASGWLINWAPRSWPSTLVSKVRRRRLCCG